MDKDKVKYMNRCKDYIQACRPDIVDTIKRGLRSRQTAEKAINEMLNYFYDAGLRDKHLSNWGIFYLCVVDYCVLMRLKNEEN